MLVCLFYVLLRCLCVCVCVCVGGGGLFFIGIIIIIIKVVIRRRILSGRTILSTHTHPRTHTHAHTPTRTKQIPPHTSKLYTLTALTYTNYEKGLTAGEDSIILTLVDLHVLECEVQHTQNRYHMHMCISSPCDENGQKIVQDKHVAYFVQPYRVNREWRYQLPHLVTCR